ncbi:RNA polymerase II-associated protein 3-like [Triticum dicoccoides]|uniref:RNA polymerase II-associated protein 3-like n=1 Tax=Triticum dicoccoides TaxID=85692 RepID=UPI00162E537B|nr:RNA polymerase II-associated protein 3-like [Triticum dicoccoides]
MADGGGGRAAELKDQGNEHFKSGNYLKAAALYTQAIKLDSDNPTLYSNRAAAFLQLVKLNKALADAETTIKLKPEWEKGYFRKGCVLEAMEQYEEAISAFQIALQHNPQNTEVARKIKRLTQLAREQKRAVDVENLRSNIDIRKNLQSLKKELATKYGDAEMGQNIFSFVISVIETAIKAWHDTGKVDAKVNFLLDDQKTDTEKYAPVVNIEKAFESPHTHGSCFAYLRQYSEESFSKAACMVAPKSIISYPQVWKGQGSRKWKLDQSDGFFVQFESPILRKIWFVASTAEKGRALCRSPEPLDITIHEILPRIFKENETSA